MDVEQFIKQHKYYHYIASICLRYYSQPQGLVTKYGLYDDFIQNQALILCELERWVVENNIQEVPGVWCTEISNYVNRAMYKFFIDCGLTKYDSAVLGSVGWHFRETAASNTHHTPAYLALYSASLYTPEELGE